MDEKKASKKCAEYFQQKDFSCDVLRLQDFLKRIYLAGYEAGDLDGFTRATIKETPEPPEAA